VRDIDRLLDLRPETGSIHFNKETQLNKNRSESLKIEGVRIVRRPDIYRRAPVIVRGSRRGLLDPGQKDAFQLVVKITHLNLPARLAVGLELESALMERRFPSLHICAPKAVRHRTTESGSPALTSACGIRLLFRRHLFQHVTSARMPRKRRAFS
jgi:hypothetical protein